MTDLPDQMYAAFIDRCGPPDVIRYGTLPVPRPGPTDVLVRVEAVSVNHVDTFVRSGAYETARPFPFVVNRDLAGAVAACGPGVVGFAVGDRVWCNSLGHAGRQGAAAQYAVVPSDRLYPLPAQADPVAMVAVAHPAASAYLALHTHGRLDAGETVLIAGAAGHVGRAAMALARGARIIATASAADLETCRALGADVALDYRDPDLAARLHDAAPDGVDLHLDTSGHHDLDLATGLLAPRGRIVLMAGLGARPVLPVGALYTRDAQIVGFAISSATTVELAAAAARIDQLVSEGSLTPSAVEHLPLSAAADAHARLESGAAKGLRLILHPPD
ncbi:NADPH:quinone reductase [Flexivirga oryzae]|uniref:NADPH:quinone reductase-like Zn-dependent oxidoreductase n=1 Tax=Flexivirga oryzae TaxID=1794944 RepID=A0A839NA13_9MICO|nr:NADPH:quinone reductase-like Zn-dependent oxidoreductase [Flexivirga oryzae]